MQKDSKTGRVVRDDLTGQVHANGTTVVRYHSPTNNGGSKWVVICGCPDKTEMVVGPRASSVALYAENVGTKCCERHGQHMG